MDADQAQVNLDGQTTCDIASAEDTVLAKLLWYQKTGGTYDHQWPPETSTMRTK